ncbi:MAG TPA: NEW3 domain-containing protein [Methanocella sp.]|jgi:uncharacterized membrane protein
MRERHLLVFLLAALAVAVALPALAVADSGYTSAFSNWVSNGTIQTVNGCNIIFTIMPNATSVHIQVQGVAGTEDVTVGTGDPYYYSNLLLIHVVQIDNNRSQAYVDIQKPATATATPTGTKIYCDTPGQLGLAGDTVTFPIVIQNYDADRTYTLSATNDAGWTTGYQYNGRDIYQIFVPEGQSKTVNLVVKTSYATPVGEKHITALADSYSISLAVSITSANSSAEVSTKVNSVIAALGDKIYYDVSINNKQSVDNNYALSLTGLPDGWYYRYVETRGSTSEMAEAVIPAATTKNIILDIVPPLSAQEGDYNFTAVITTPDGIAVSKVLTLKLKGSSNMAVTSEKQAYSAKPGQTFGIKVYVTNDGNGAALTNVYPDVSAPSGWTVSSSPSQVNSLKSGETQMFTISVQPPANIVASDYDVSVTVKSDQDEGSSSFRITVTTDSIVPFVGGGIVLVVIVGLVLMYRKYGRR